MEEFITKLMEKFISLGPEPADLSGWRVQRLGDHVAAPLVACARYTDRTVTQTIRPHPARRRPGA